MFKQAIKEMLTIVITGLNRILNQNLKFKNRFANVCQRENNRLFRRNNRLNFYTDENKQFFFLIPHVVYNHYCLQCSQDINCIRDR